jgi:hypothetical protein
MRYRSDSPNPLKPEIRLYFPDQIQMASHHLDLIWEIEAEIEADIRLLLSIDARRI